MTIHRSVGWLGFDAECGPTQPTGEVTTHQARTLFARNALIDAVGQEPEPETAAEIIDEFKDFIENVSPEDFQ